MTKQIINLVSTIYKLVIIKYRLHYKENAPKRDIKESNDFPQRDCQETSITNIRKAPQITAKEINIIPIDKLMLKKLLVSSRQQVVPLPGPDILNLG